MFQFCCTHVLYSISGWDSVELRESCRKHDALRKCRPRLPMADTQEQEEHAEQHPEQPVANAVELNVDTPPEGADVAEINGSEATYGDTVAHPEPVASPAEQDSNIEETPVQTSSPDLEINEHHTAGAAGTGASTEAAAAGVLPELQFSFAPV